MVTSQCLQIAAAADHLARLRILADDIVVIDLMLGNLITRSGCSPVPIDRRPNDSAEVVSRCRGVGCRFIFVVHDVIIRPAPNAVLKRSQVMLASAN